MSTLRPPPVLPLTLAETFSLLRYFLINRLILVLLRGTVSNRDSAVPIFPTLLLRVEDYLRTKRRTR